MVRIFLKLLLLSFLFLGCRQTEDITQSEVVKIVEKPEFNSSTSLNIPNGEMGPDALDAASFFGTASITQFTISYWMKMNTDAVSGYVMAIDANADDRFEIIWQNGTPAQMIYLVIGLNQGTSVSAPVANHKQWNHFVHTYSHDPGPSRNTIALYINGVRVIQNIKTGGPITLAGPRSVQLSPFGTTLSDSNIEEFAVWSELLTSEDIAKLYDNQKMVDLNTVNSNYRAWWRMGENNINPNILADESGNFSLPISSNINFSGDVPFPSPEPLHGIVSGNPSGDGGGGSDPFGGGSDGYGGELGDGGASGGEFP